jgi:hypothetical protein
VEGQGWGRTICSRTCRCLQRIRALLHGKELFKGAQLLLLQNRGLELAPDAVLPAGDLGPEDGAQLLPRRRHLHGGEGDPGNQRDALFGGARRGRRNGALLPRRRGWRWWPWRGLSSSWRRRRGRWRALLARRRRGHRRRRLAFARGRWRGRWRLSWGLLPARRRRRGRRGRRGLRIGGRRRGRHRRGGRLSGRWGRRRRRRRGLF